MLRYRWLLLPALLFAALSAGGLGAGLIGVRPVLDNILGDTPRGLPELATDFNQRLPAWAPGIPDSVIQSLPHGAFNAVLWIVIGLGLLTVFGAVCNFMHAYLALTIISRTIANIRREAFHRVVHLPLKTVLRQGPSDFISRIVYDTATLGSGFNALLSRALAQATKAIVAAATAFYFDWRMASAALIAAPLVATIIRKLGKRIRRASKKALEAQAGLYHSTSEVLSGLRVVKAHANERYEEGKFHTINKRVVQQEFQVRTARALASPLVETVSIIVLGVLALIAVKAILDGHLDKTNSLMVLGALALAAAQIKPLTGFLNDIQQASAAAERLNVLMGMESEQGHDAKLPKLARHAQTVAFENVALTYPGAETPALRGVSVSIPHGKTYAFVGPNGCGKTTLLSLVPRLFDADAGRVLIDGRDIRGFSIRSLRRQIGVVTQETVLFRGTIRSNIAYGAENVTEDKVRDAAQRARAEEFILAKPGGYDFEVGEQGAGLSGGQRQRIAIARAILRDPAILILDEATSMIDAESEAKIAEAIAEFAKSRTCLIVAHRLSTVINADAIVVMDQGRIIDQGTHAQLLTRCAVYKSLVNSQLLRGGDDREAA